MLGYWEPHTSSVDFCEPNYFLTSYVAEPHNTWSSLLITFIASFGLLYGNPLNEWSIAMMYGVLAVIGVGSAGLHSTLHWVLQSSDEVPMLWQTVSFLNVPLLLHFPKLSLVNQHRMGYGFITLAIMQTILYYRYQQTYAVFIASIVIYSAIIVFWTGSILRENIATDQKAVLWLLWKWAFISYVILGAGLWVVDMNLCPFLLSLYASTTGFTLHAFWHFFAGMGTYLIATFLVAVKLQKAGKQAELKWVLPFIPVCTEKKTKFA